MYAIEVNQLCKHYGDHRALDGATLAVHTGEVYGLLGPNGAGKTTLMKTVLGLQRPSGGTISLFGQPYQRRLLADIGALVEMPGLWQTLDAQTHLRIHAKLRGVPESWIKRVLDLVQLDAVASKTVAKYSLGMRWRLGIAIALLVRPKLVLLDEPTNGLDPVGIREMRATIRRLAAEGTTVVVSSHQLSEIAQVCDRIGVLVAGRTQYEGPTANLAIDGDLEAGFFSLLEQTSGGVR